MTKWLAAFFSIIISLLLVEVLLHIIDYPRHFCPNVEAAYETQFDQDVGWIYSPFQSYAKQGIPYEITAEGFRSAQKTDKADFSKPIVLLVGDSYLFGHGLPFEETFGFKLQQLLGPKYEVVNFSAQSYGTDQMYLLLHRLLPQYKPVLVITDYISDHDFRNITNDRRDLVPCLKFPGTKPKFSLKSGRLKEVSKPEPYDEFDRIKLRAALARLFRGSLQEKADHEGHELSKALITKMKEESEAQGARFAVISFDHDSLEFRQELGDGEVLGLSTDGPVDSDMYHLSKTDPHPNNLGTSRAVEAFLQYFWADFVPGSAK